LPVFRLDRRLIFPRPELAERSGVLAVGGDLSPERLILAYESGIFPWYDEDLPILWHSPDPRYVLRTSALHVPRSLAKQIRRAPYVIRTDERFRDVMQRCAEVPRPGQSGTWITPEMLDAYVRLHEMGLAHSIEAYEGDELVGGLYGVSLGRMFFGESMFADAPDASKIAFVTLVRALDPWGIDLVDCQVRTDHLERFGAEAWPRAKYLKELAARLEAPTKKGKWSLDAQALRLTSAALG
jgi:leucyl/phenylalanyl-tRNA--protein transferase